MEVCSACFTDDEIKKFIHAFSTRKAYCRYCGKKDVPVIDISEVLDFFEELIALYTPDKNGIPILEMINRDWEIFSLIGGKDLLNKLLEMLKSEIKTSQTKVNYIPDLKYNIHLWDKLKRELKWERRYFPNISFMENAGWDAFFSELVEYSDQKTFYRARIHQSDNMSPYKKQEMGVPDNLKVKPGRANPQGIPYLYLSDSELTTLYETRALFKDELSIGKFKVKKGITLKLFDFTCRPSAFVANGFLNSFAKGILLKNKISEDLSKPIRRYDSTIDYVPTQFICEYLNYKIGADGLIFDSSLHSEGQNVVIFNPDKLECVEVNKRIVTALDLRFD
jgi:hypothetical protein